MKEKLKNRLLSLKVWLIHFVTLSAFYININNVYGADYLFKDIVYLHDYLIKSDLGGWFQKWIGQTLYNLSSWMLNGCYEAYTSINQLDILQNANVKTLLNNLDKLVYSVFFIIFIIAVICKIFKIENPLKVLGNTFACFVFVIVFSSVLAMGTKFKNATIKDINSLVNNGDYKISETILSQNTVDVLKSLKQGKVVHLETGEVDMYAYDEIIKKGVLGDYPRVDEDGQVAYDEFDNGLFWTGLGEVRYYRYNTDFWTVNCTIVASVLVYILAMMKHAFLIVDWFNINIFGKFSIGRGIFDIKSLGNVGKSIAGNLISQVILYAMMSLFSVFSSVIMTSDFHFIYKCLMIWGYGMTVFVGSQFITKGMGIDDNFGKVAGAMFASTRMTKPFRKLGKKLGKDILSGTEDLAKNVGEKIVGKTYDDIVDDYQDKFDKAMESDGMKEALHEGRERDDIDLEKEKMQQKDYDDSIKEKAKQELYGDDYKLQQEKEKIQQVDENKALKEQAKQELYGDDYKVQEEKDKLLDAEERSKNMDQAKRELFGDDYKLQEEKQKLMNAEEHSENVKTAKQELYGDDYRYKEVKQEVIDSEEHAKLVKQAKEELHGTGWKERQMEGQVRESLQREEIKQRLLEEKGQHRISFEDSSETQDEVDIDEFNSLLDQLKKGEL